MTSPVALRTSDDGSDDNKRAFVSGSAGVGTHENNKVRDDHDDDHDDFRSISHQMAGEGPDALFHNDRAPGRTPNATSDRTSYIPGYDDYSPACITVDYTDPLVVTEEMLWARPNIGDLVESTLARMGRAFAYNSVYILKVVMDLQLAYRSAHRLQLPESAFLSLDLALRTATVLSHRLTRKQTDNASLSRELQLRTLISTLTLITTETTSSSGPHKKLPSSTYARLLRDISESDADNQALYAEDGYNAIKLGDNEYLTRYTCDLVRSLPADMPPPSPDLNEEAIHFLFAAGFINQLEERPSRKTINELLSRIRAEPSYWHVEFQQMYDDAAGAIRCSHQKKFKTPTQKAQFAVPWASEVANTISARLETELDRYQRLMEISISGTAISEPGEKWDNALINRDDEIFIFGMLDLLSQLVSAFPNCRPIAEGAVALALRVVRESHKQAFRSKALEIMLCSTVGVGENEYYETMRALDSVIEDIANPDGGLENKTQEERHLILEHVEQLKQEKREAMDRYEKKAVLHTGAMESIQRRIYSESTPENYMRALDYFQRQDLHFNPQTYEGNRTTSIGRTSGVPTLSSTGTSSQDPREDHMETLSSTEVGTMDSMAVLVSSPADAMSCHCFSPTDTPCDTCTCRNPSSRDPMPDEAPLMLLPTPSTSFDKPNTNPTSPQSVMLPIMLEEFVPSTPTDSAFGTDSALAKARRRSMELPIPVITPGSDLASNSGASHDASLTGKDEKHLDSALTTPASAYPEPSNTRPPSTISLAGSNSSRRRRSMRESFSDLIPLWPKKPPQLHKPLPPAPTPEFERKLSTVAAASESISSRAPAPSEPRNYDRSQTSMSEEVSEEKEVVPVQPEPGMPGRSYSSPDMRPSQSTASLSSHHRKHSYTHGAPPVTQPGFTQLATISDNSTEHGYVAPYDAPNTVDYTYQPNEMAYTLPAKATCFTTALSPDGDHVAFLSPLSFQVWKIPSVDQPPPQKPLYIYNLGEFEGLKKSKVKSEYKAIAMSEQYLTTMTKDRIYVHDIFDQNRVIHHEIVKGWQFSAVAINATTLVMGLSNTVGKGEQVGKIQIFRMNPPTPPGSASRPRCELVKDLNLPIHPNEQPQDAPHVITLSGCGRYLSCGTPKFGYYFTWDLWQPEPRILVNRRLRFVEGPNAEVITNVAVFPDAKHLFVSTFPAQSTITAKGKTNGSYIESLIYGIQGHNQRSTGQVSPRVNASAMASTGEALAFLSYNGTVWITPVTRYEHDDNLTCYMSNKSSHKLSIQNDNVILPFGSVIFSSDGTRVVAADRKGKILVLVFPLKSPEEQTATSSQYPNYVYGVQRQPSTMTHMSHATYMTNTGGNRYYAGTSAYNVSMTSFQAPSNVSAVSLMSPVSGNQDYGGFF